MYGDTHGSSIQPGDWVEVTDGDAAFREVSARVKTGERGRVVQVDRGLGFPWWIRFRSESGVSWMLPANFVAKVEG